MQDTSRVRIWDLPTRLFHWVLVLLVLTAFITAEFGTPEISLPAWIPGGAREIPHMVLHMWCGYGVLVLLVFRLVWGFAGSSTARFSQFMRGPGAMIAYGRSLFGRASSFVAGHNPLGGAMVLALLTVLTIQAATGLFTKDEDDFFNVAVGPLNSSVSEGTGLWLTSLHHYNFIAVQWLVIIHIAANLYYWLVRRENLIAAMISGAKPLPTGAMPPQLQFASTARALVILACAVVLVWGVVTVLPG